MLFVDTRWSSRLPGEPPAARRLETAPWRQQEVPEVPPKACRFSMSGVSEIIREVFYFFPNQSDKNSGGVRGRCVAAPSCTLEY